ncbi:MAG: hypothetical protein RI978_681 [Verrucomicrobiota bacterium]|jgi:hypothetical protein
MSPAVRLLALLAAAYAVPTLQAHIPPVEAKYREAVTATLVAPSAKLYLNFTTLAAGTTNGTPPALAAPFQAFAPKVGVRWDEKYLYVEAKGLPDHPLMAGIKSWQQQVPIPQTYAGDKAWRIPLHPVPAKEPMSAKTHFMRGAIALAANGIPIFNALNNRGDDAKKFGELDDFGGHCGKGDDYHYHDAPVFLEKTLGKGKPIAVALDGYAIYGYNEPDGSVPGKLDEFGGHATKALGYHYHAQKVYPYINGGFHGEVTEVGGQVDPQPSASHVRKEGSAYSQSPLRGALIKDFTPSPDGKAFELRYTLNGKALSVKYVANEDGTWTFTYSRPDGTPVVETYKPNERGPGGGGAKGEGKGGKGGKGGKRPPNEPEGAKGETGDLGEQAQPGNPEANRPKSDRPKGGKGGKGDPSGLIKPSPTDALKLNVYADNWFVLFINGKLRVVDPIEYMPHNVVSVDIMPEYPMTIAVMAMDNADPKTGLEYGNRMGDAGLIIKFSDGTVTNAKWKAKSFFKGPLNRDIASPKVQHDPIPANWYAVDFDDSSWAQATEFTEERVSPKESFTKAKENFAGAQFIWTADLDLDNTVLFRTKVEAPAGYKQRWTAKPEVDMTTVTKQLLNK